MNQVLSLPELIDELTVVVADTTVVDILNQYEHDDRIRAAGVDPIVFRYINETGEDVEVCRENLDMGVLTFDVPHVLDENTLVRPKPVKTDLGEYVNTQVVEGKWGSIKPVDA